MKIPTFLSVLLLAPVIAFNQEIAPHVNVNPLKFGFNIAPNISNIHVDKRLATGVSMENGLGYRIGIRADYSFNRTISISGEMDWSFDGGRFKFSDSSYNNYLIMPASIDFMTHIIFKKQRVTLSPYVLIGPNVRIPIFKKSKSIEYVTNTDLAINLGIGFQKNYMYFSFSPELRYSYGLLNVSTHPLIPSARYDNISLVLNFKI